MSNQVNVIINGKDNSRSAFDSAAVSAKKFAGELKGVGATLAQAGSVAVTFGNNQLATAIGQVEGGILAIRALGKELEHSKIAFVGIAVAATAGGYAIGDMVRKYVPFFNSVDKAEAMATALERIGAVQNQRLALRDPARAALNTSNRTIDKAVHESIQSGKGTDEDSQLVFQLLKLKDETNEKFRADELAKETEQRQKIIDLQQKFGMESVAWEDEFAGQKLEVRAWESEQRRILDEAEEKKHIDVSQARVDLAKASAIRIAKINIAAADADLKHEREMFARKAQLHQNYAQIASTFLGAIATTAQAFGKKGFAVFKAFSMAQAVVDTYKGAVAAYAWASEFGGPAAGAIAAAAAIAAGLANVAQIAAQKPAGVAHGGLEYVPSEGTYILQRGERVIQPKQNAQLQDLLDRRDSGGTGMVSVQVFLDSRSILKTISEASSDGRLRINARAVA